MNWGSPDQFNWMWAVVGYACLIVLVELFKLRRLRQFADSKLLPQMVISLSRYKRNIRYLLLVIAMVCLVIALARPQSAGESVEVKHQGIDMVIAMDVSDSMLAEDIRPNRLEKAKLELQDLVDVTEGDRIGVVAFAGNAYIQVPLTLDRNAVKLFLKSVSNQSIPVPGTAIARAAEVSLSMFDYEKDGDKVVVLLTDGEDHEGDPLKVAREAKKRGVRIFTIGIGTPEGEMIPMRVGNQGVSFKKDLFGKTVVSKLDEKTLMDMASLTGGAYFRSGLGLLEADRLYQSIQTLRKTQTGTGWIMQYDPRYQLPVVIAFVLLLWQWAMSETRRGKNS